MRAITALAAAVAAAAAVSRVGAIPTVVAGPIITLDGTTQAYTYEGHGGLSAGASSRLLYDYPEPQRSDVLDYLFKPSFGMGLHIIKVEIGGDTQSTDGSEASHMHTRDDCNSSTGAGGVSSTGEGAPSSSTTSTSSSGNTGCYSCDRGYELWLVQEAKKRNPNIKTYALSWGVPRWIGEDQYFSSDNIEYQTNFVRCAVAKTGAPFDYIGIWNERPWGTMDYVLGLRESLDAAGFSSTKIVIPDGGYDVALLQDTASNSTFSAAWDVMGLHYPCPHRAYATPGPHDLGKSFWASEDWWSQPDWPSAAAWGRLLNQNYVHANLTTTIAWSPLWSVYTNLPDEEAGLMRARMPWTGTFDISPPIWTSAQWMQFTQPGWKYLSTTSGGSGWLPGNGSYVTLVDPASPSTGFTLILETFVSGGRCPTDHPASAPQTVTFRLTGGLPAPGTSLAVWQTNETDMFVQLPDIVIASDGTITLSIGVDTMVTVSTVRTASKGQPSAPIPAPGPFPFPYSDDFSDAVYPYDWFARYFADQFGSFATRNGSMVQVAVGNPDANAWVTDADPVTIIGDVNWTDTAVGIVARFEPAAGPASRQPSASSSVSSSNRGGRVGDGQPAMLVACDASSPFQVWVWNVTGQGYLSNTPGSVPTRQQMNKKKRNTRQSRRLKASGAVEYDGSGDEESFDVDVDVASSGQQCFNVYGCDTEIVYWSCVTQGGTCCGGSCYKVRMWGGKCV
jgi:galactosylceramidase